MAKKKVDYTDRLEALNGKYLVKWLAGYSPVDGLVNLEGSHLLVAGIDSRGLPWKRSDSELLSVLDAALDGRATCVSFLPLPAVYKKVSDPEKATPRITGELIAELKCRGLFDESAVSVRDMVKGHMAELAQPFHGGYLFPASLVDAPGLTMLALGTYLGESFLVPESVLDASDMTMRIEARGGFFR